MNETTGKHKQLLLASMVAIVLLSSSMLALNFSAYADNGSNNDSKDDNEKNNSHTTPIVTILHNTLPQISSNSSHGYDEHKKALKVQVESDGHRDVCSTTTDGKYNHECDENGDDQSCKSTTNGKYDHECDKDGDREGTGNQVGNENIGNAVHEDNGNKGGNGNHYGWNNPHANIHARK